MGDEPRDDSDNVIYRVCCCVKNYLHRLSLLERNKGVLDGGNLRKERRFLENLAKGCPRDSDF